MIAVDAIEGALLGLVNARFFSRTGGKAAQHKDKAFAEKESRRWLDDAERAAGSTSGANCVTVVADREGDIYEDFACKPAGAEEDIFGWLKTIGGLRQTRFRRLDRVRLALTFALAAYNLIRMPKLSGASA